MVKPPPLKNDCFALPSGVDWTPVDDALAMLRRGLHCVTDTEEVEIAAAGGRKLAADVFAARSSPPYANSAVDGYGFSFESLPEKAVFELPLAQGCAAAGVPFDGMLTAGQALRILTGARVPEGVDTVVLEEDCSISDNHIAFRSGLKRGANTRAKGEDVEAGTLIFSAHKKLRSQDLALLAAVGVATVSVQQKLRVAVLSTGDEVIPVGQAATNAQVYDANKAMLLDTIRSWGFVAVDLGHVRDDANLVKDAFDRGAEQVDAILTSGGASAGDQDHVSAVLTANGDVQTWRIAVKPGRPLVLALWKGVPVFGLPGNPVAALICTLVFARPALSLLAGADWHEPVGFYVPAAFSKNKRAGRREYLRARVNNGRVEVFKSEGSGRISGLSWADGLVELNDSAQVVSEDDLVRYYPFGSFGI